MMTWRIINRKKAFRMEFRKRPILLHSIIGTHELARFQKRLSVNPPVAFRSLEIVAASHLRLEVVVPPSS